MEKAANRFKLKTEKIGPLKASIIDATTGKAVPDQCNDVEWFVGGSNSEECAFLDSIQLDSVKAPNVVIFE